LKTGKDLKGIILFITFAILISTCSIYTGKSYLLTFADENNTSEEIQRNEDMPTEELVITNNIQEDISEDQSVDGDNVERPKIVRNPMGVIEGHKLIAQNQKFEMYFKEDNLSIIIRDKQSGAVMYSTVSQVNEKDDIMWQNFMRSGIVMEYLKGTNVVVYKADMYSGNPEKTIFINENGFSALVKYNELQISYQVNVTLTETGFVVEIPQESIVEEGDLYKVAGFYVYPFLGYSRLGDREGYMFIPDGSGALIYLEDNQGKFKQPFSEMVYGRNIGIDDPYVLSLFNGYQPVMDPEKILAPVFGMVHTDSKIGFLAIIEKGDFSARIEAYPNGAVTDYDWISARFIYRQVYVQPTSRTTGSIVVRQEKRNNFDIKIRYEFVTGEEANYVGLAKRFREYIIENNLIEKKDNTFNVRIDFLGADKENWLLFRRIVPMTTTENIKEIISELKHDGIENILAIYKGWQKGGIYGGLPITGFNVERALGGNKGLRELISELNDMGVKLYLFHDALRVNTVEKPTMAYNIVRRLNKRIFEEEVFGKVYEKFHYLTPEKSLEIVTKNKDSYVRNNVDNIVLSGISNNLFSYTFRGESRDRVFTAGIYKKIVQDYYEQFNLILEQPFFYLWDYTSAIIDMPMEDSKYIFTDEYVPFFAIALKGLIPMYSKYANFQANENEYFLKLIEQGVYPSFLITYEEPAKLIYTNSSGVYTSQFERYREMIGYYYNELKQVNDMIQDAFIVDYRRVAGVVKVKYSNGVVIYVNYNHEPINMDGLLIEPRYYKVVKQR